MARNDLSKCKPFGFFQVRKKQNTVVMVQSWCAVACILERTLYLRTENLILKS